jgi:ABC-type uncharacterized transport system permease subunit
VQALPRLWLEVMAMAGLAGLVAIMLATGKDIDAIIPTWAFMLVAIQLSGVAQKTFFGKKQQLLEAYYHDFISRLDIKQYIDAKTVIKGCSKLPVPDSAYLDIAAQLKPVAKSIMYGEPCSTVPLYKKPKQ